MNRRSGKVSCDAAGSVSGRAQFRSAEHRERGVAEDRGSFLVLSASSRGEAE